MHFTLSENTTVTVAIWKAL